MTDDLRDRYAQALMAAFDKTAIVCNHTQLVQFAPLADAVMAVRDAELAEARAKLITATNIANTEQAERQRAEAERDAASLIVTELQALRDSLYTHLESAQQRAEQVEDLLRIAHDTSNKSEAERARAVQRAEEAEAQVAALQQALADRGDDVLAFQKACGTHLPEQAAKIRAERDALKAAIERVRGRLDTLIADGFGATTPTLRELRAALDAPETAPQTTTAQETPQ